MKLTLNRGTDVVAGLCIPSCPAPSFHVGSWCWWTVRTERMRVVIMGISNSWGGVASHG